MVNNIKKEWENKQKSGIKKKKKFQVNKNEFQIPKVNKTKKNYARR